MIYDRAELTKLLVSLLYKLQKEELDSSVLDAYLQENQGITLAKFMECCNTLLMCGMRTFPKCPHGIARICICDGGPGLQCGYCISEKPYVPRKFK